VVGYTERHRHLGQSGGALDPRRWWPPGRHLHNAYGYGMFTGGLGAHYGAERWAAPSIPMSGGQTEKQVAADLDFKPDIIMVTPSYSLVIAEEFEPPGHGPDRDFAQGRHLRRRALGRGMRAEIERKLGIDAVDIYGLTEVMGPGVASECIESKDGPVIWEDHFYPEIINPETGEVWPTAKTANWCSPR
jgi:phenylacetate-CoA ligase